MRDCSGYLLIPKEDHARADNSKGSTLTEISFSLNKTKDMSKFSLESGLFYVQINPISRTLLRMPV